jgi:hypothetical protein
VQWLQGRARSRSQVQGARGINTEAKDERSPGVEHTSPGSIGCHAAWQTYAVPVQKVEATERSQWTSNTEEGGTLGGTDNLKKAERTMSDIKHRKRGHEISGSNAFGHVHLSLS